MKKIYFKPHSSRRAEISFFDFLINGDDQICHIPENFKLPDKYIEKLLDTNDLKSSIISCEHILEKKKYIIIEYLNLLPNRIKVAESMDYVSVDFVIKDQSNITLIEFHEKQHSRLSDKRLRPIFSNTNERYEVPRYLHRLIKDVWRWKHLTNFKIIWQNWFDRNNDNSVKFEMNKNQEFGLPNRFTISSL